MIKKPELLAPAGDYTRFLYAIEYGADAVYIGGECFSLRQASTNFTLEEIAKATAYAHSRGVKVYVAVNTVPRNDEIEEYPAYLDGLAAAKVDAVIIGDMGLFAMTRRLHPEMEIHISTQMNTINYEDCNMWYSLGVKRVVLSRECSLEEIKRIRQKIPADMELEAFCHGAMCMAHSGRCLISAFLTDRDPNRGACTQPCRWKYSVVEETRPGQYFPVDEDENGTYFFNSKDLCMIEHVPDMINAGISSLKIEGRVKTEYYVAAVTSAYRRAIDDCFEDLDLFAKNLPTYLSEVGKVSHRAYGTGFYYGNPLEKGQNYETGGYIREYEVSALVTGYDSVNKRIHLVQRNKFSVGDTVELMQPGRDPVEFTVTEMRDSEGNLVFSAPHPEMKLTVPYNRYVPDFSIIRRAKI
jgi:putative protease